MKIGRLVDNINTLVNDWITDAKITIFVPCNICKTSDKSHKFTLKVCYEACYLGFSLYSELIKNKINCEVLASNAIPKSPNDRVKTDKKDSKKLAILYMKGMLTPVHVPDQEDEAERDLIRS